KRAGRVADDSQDLGSRGLLLKRFTQLVEQAGIFVGDNGLRGEKLDQLDLLGGGGANLLTKKRHLARQNVVLDHRYHEYCPDAAEFNARNCQRVAVKVGLICKKVGNVDYLAGLDDTAHWS